MNPEAIFDFLELANARPEPFSIYTARELWTDEHTSSQMLAYHLNGDIDLSSRRKSFIDDSASWMAERFKLTTVSRVIDFGCGPGLYTSRFARLGTDVTGIDFSSRSIAYAREFANERGLEVNYVEADYLEFQPEGKFDLITMIMCDFCVLSPPQRAALLEKFRDLLAEDGCILLDAYSLSAFDAKTEMSFFEKNQLNGFWSDQPYYALVSSFKYDPEKVSLDKYTIVEQGRVRQVYNWLQHFTTKMLAQEASAAGLELIETHGDVAGNRFEKASSEFAVVLTKHG